MVDIIDDTNIRQAELADMENNWKRALADYRNLEKRVAEERELIAAFSNAALVTRLLSVVDNLEILSNHVNDAGLVLILKEFKQILADEGLKEIDAMNAEFDATIMEAVDTEEGKEPNKVFEVVRKGYLLKNKLLRPARVKVGKESL